MGRTPEGFLLGHGSTPLGVGGAVAIDAFDNTHRARTHGIVKGQKNPVDSFEEFSEIVAKNGIVVEASYLGASPGNLAVGYRKVSDESDGHVIMYTVLAESDKSTPRIRRAMERRGIELRLTDYDGLDTRNPISLILPPRKNRTIVSFKQNDSPPISYDHPGATPGTLVLGTQSGDHWPKGVRAGVDYATDNGIPLVVHGSESQIVQTFSNKKKKDAYQHLLKNATGFFGNAYEAIMLLESFNVRIFEIEAELIARTLKEACGDAMQFVRITYGAKGAFAVGPDDTFYRLHVPKLPNIGRGRIVNTLGGGDEATAVGLYVLRTEGTDPDGIDKSLIKGARAATMVMHKPDAQSGQMQRRDYERKNRGYRVDRTEPTPWF